MYRLVIKARNKMFVVRGIPVRTPTTIEKLTQTELNFYLSKVRMEGLLDKDYYYEKMGDKSVYPKTRIYNNDNVDGIEDVVIEDLSKDFNESKSTLDKILNEK